MNLRFYPEPVGTEAEIRERARRFADEHVRPTALEDDQKALFRREIFDRLCAQGLHNLAVPKEYGGGGLGADLQYACIEELTRASASIAVTVGVTNLIIGALMAFGNADQKEKYLRPLVTGKWLGAFALSEPQAGSDAASLRCAARRRDGGYLVTGTKMWCSNAGHADLYLLMARTGPDRTQGVTAFVVPKDTPGFRVSKQEKKLGLRASTLAELSFENCFLPDTLCVGREGDGLKVALSQLDGGRITIGVAGVALAAEALDRAWRYFTERKRRGLPFEDAVRHRLARHYADTQAVKALVATAARLRGEGKPITLPASQVKLLGSDLAMGVTSDVVSLMGPDGVRPEFEVERLMRDAKALQIVEGTNQIQELVIAREMDGMFA